MKWSVTFTAWLAIGLASAAGLQAAGQSAATAASKPADPLAVPDGSPAELLAFIRQLQAAKPAPEQSLAERRLQLRKTQEAVLKAADKILAAKPDDATAGQAIGAKFSAWAAEPAGRGVGRQANGPTGRAVQERFAPSRSRRGVAAICSEKEFRKPFTSAAVDSPSTRISASASGCKSVRPRVRSVTHPAVVNMDQQETLPGYSHRCPVGRGAASPMRRQPSSGAASRAVTCKGGSMLPSTTSRDPIGVSRPRHRKQPDRHEFRLRIRRIFPKSISKLFSIGWYSTARLVEQ